MKRIIVLPPDDYEIVRKEFRKTIEFEADREVIGEAQDACRAIALQQFRHLSDNIPARGKENTPWCQRASLRIL
jgi:hypothetical protein